MNNALSLQMVTFPNRNSSALLRVPQSIEAGEVVTVLKLPLPRALLLINGGAAEDIDIRIQEQLEVLFIDIARYVIKNEIMVITGGTNAGVFALWGKALQHSGKPTAPCVGGAVTGRTTIDNLEAHHTHFVLVEEKTGEMRPLLCIVSLML